MFYIMLVSIEKLHCPQLCCWAKYNDFNIYHIKTIMFNVLLLKTLKPQEIGTNIPIYTFRNTT